MLLASQCFSAKYLHQATNRITTDIQVTISLACATNRGVEHNCDYIWFDRFSGKHAARNQLFWACTVFDSARQKSDGQQAW